MLCSKALLALPFLLLPLSAQQGELDTLVAGEAARAAEEQVELVWARAMAVRQAEELGGEGELDAALDRLVAREGLSPQGLLFAAAARLQGEDPDPAKLAPALRPLLKGAPEVARAAGGLLANPVFRSLPPKQREELGQSLVAAARDLERDPETRMALATAAAKVGRGTEMRQAREEMQAFMTSADPNLRALGALALAGVVGEIEGDVRHELERLAGVPDARGTLAASYLKLEELRELHDRQTKDLRAQAEGGELPENLKRFQAVERMITNYHLEGNRVSEDELTEAALNGMLRHMDEHSSYFGPEAYAKFLLELEAEYGGIGAYVGLDPIDRLFTISRPIYSGPAYRAGLQTDDKIVRIDDWPTIGEPVDDVIKRLKGRPGTDVKLYVWRRGMDPDLIDRPEESMAVVLKREDIHIPAVAQQMLPGGIAMVELTTFSRDVGSELKQALLELEGQGMRGVILDLRRNSGGLLTEARNVAELFLPKDKKVVETHGTLSGPEVHKTLVDPILPLDMPVIVLTSRFTASASEIVAGALQDWQRATVLGETSFGKGSVQLLLPVESIEQDEWDDQNGNDRWDTWEPILKDHDGDGVVDYSPRVKMTVQKYLLPTGRSIHRELDSEGNVLSEGGIKPDVEVKFPLIDSWRVAERQRVHQTGKIKDYVSAHWQEGFDLFRRLAITDLKDESQYPDFNQLMLQLETTLPRDDVRMLVRSEVRRRIQDDRGAEFPIGDFEEDYQVQRAVDNLLKRFDESPDAYPAYAKTFLSPAQVEEDRVAALAPEDRERVRDAEALILELRDGGAEVTREQLDQLLRTLGYTDAEPGEKKQ
jgi:carboxyl-terminal processing protease